MIPKKIHYCWFGRGEKPKLAKKCIASWKKYCPDYEIIEWNEDNFDVNCCMYTREAYEAKRYAFVSDHARYDIIYKNGGLYFDTDVELIRPIDDILKNGNFMGFEIDGTGSAFGKVNPGVGIGAEPALAVYREILQHYGALHFVMEDGSLNTKTVVDYTTDILCAHGMQPMGDLQHVEDIWIYPREYFNPRNNNTGVLEITENTRSIHWYSMSWLPKHRVFLTSIARVFHRWFGEDCELYRNNCFGNKGSQGESLDAPVIGDHVSFGVGANAIGKIQICSHVQTNSMCLVDKDITVKGLNGGVPVKRLGGMA